MAAGLSISEVARKLGVSEATYYRWRKNLKKEKRPLKRLIGEMELNKTILKEALEGKD